MDPVILAGLGSIIGAFARFTLGELPVMGDWRTLLDFPIVTLGINWLGCFLLGIILHHFTGNTATFWGTGVMGGFTTFSTFTVETLGFIEDNQWRKAVLYWGLSGGVGLLLAVLGLHL